MIGEVKTHVFEVCFTTKPLGTDLAVATCRTNVQPSGEHIDVSQTGPLLRGTKVLHVVEDVLSTLNQFAHRILVVEDDISIRQLTTELLLRSGYEVDAACDGEVGWEALQCKRYDLLITDNFMPKVTGIEMIKKLNAAGLQLPVILATAVLPPWEFTLHPWLHAVPTLFKPFKAAELLSAVKNVLSVSDSAGERIAPPS